MFRELWPLRALRSVAPRRPAPLCPAGCLALACAVCAVSRALWCVVERDHLCLWRLRSGARGSPQRRAQAQQAPGWDFSGTHTHHTHSPRHCLQFCGARVRLRRSWARLSRGSSTLAPLSWTWTWSCGLRKQGGPLQDDHEVPQRVGREREPQLTARLLVQACRVRVRVGAGFGLGLALGLGLGLGLGWVLGIGLLTNRHPSLPPSRPPRAAKKSGPPSPPKACLAGGEVRVVT